jgi:hypothetical protein
MYSSIVYYTFLIIIIHELFCFLSLFLARTEVDRVAEVRDKEVEKNK